jgi:hypothetical protein
VADAMKAGKQIEHKEFENLTFLVSDIVSFTTLRYVRKGKPHFFLEK